jgi:hypothetical protein
LGCDASCSGVCLRRGLPAGVDQSEAGGGVSGLNRCSSHTRRFRNLLCFSHSTRRLPVARPGLRGSRARRGPDDIEDAVGDGGGALSARSRSLVQSGPGSRRCAKGGLRVDDPEAALLHPPGDAGVRRPRSIAPAGRPEHERRRPGGALVRGIAERGLAALDVDLDGRRSR